MAWSEERQRLQRAAERLEREYLEELTYRARFGGDLSRAQALYELVQRYHRALERTSLQSTWQQRQAA